MPLTPQEIDALDTASAPPQTRAVPNLSPQDIDAIPTAPPQRQLSPQEIDETPAAPAPDLSDTRPPSIPQLPNRVAAENVAPPQAPPPDESGFHVSPKEKPLEQLGAVRGTAEVSKFLFRIPWSRIPGVQFSKETTEKLLSMPAAIIRHYVEEMPDKEVTTPEGEKTAVAPESETLDKLANVVPSETTVDRITGLQHSVAKTADYVLSPAGFLAPTVFSAIPSIARRLIAAGLAALMGKNALDKSVELYTELNRPEPDQQKVGELGGDILTDTGFGILSGIGATKGIGREQAVKDFLTKKSVEEFVDMYGEKELKAMFERVQTGRATPEETAYYNWVTTGNVQGPPMEPTSQVGVTTARTVTTPKYRFPPWLNRYLGLKPEEGILLSRTPGERIRPRSLLSNREIDQTPPAPEPAQPPEAPNAPSVPSPVGEAPPSQTVSVPQVPAGSPSPILGPAETGQAPEEIAGRVGPVPAPTPASAPPAISEPQPKPVPPVPSAPTLPPKHTAIIIRRADGSEYPAAFGGYWTQIPGVPAMISRFDPTTNFWTSGGLNPGETIVAGDVPQKPDHEPLTPITTSGETHPNPTPAQVESGNYPKRTIKMHGMEISIENEKGGIRRSKPGAPPWEVVMPAAYGYIKGTKDNTGENVDVYVGDNPASKAVYVIDQINPDTKAFDEPKVMLGFNSTKEAEAAYVKAFSDGRGPERIGAMTGITMKEFKAWLKKGGQRNPLAYQAPEGGIAETQLAAAPEAKTQPPPAIPKPESQLANLQRITGPGQKQLESYIDVAQRPDGKWVTGARHQGGGWSVEMNQDGHDTREDAIDWAAAQIIKHAQNVLRRPGGWVISDKEFDNAGKVLDWAVGLLQEKTRNAAIERGKKPPEGPNEPERGPTIPSSPGPSGGPVAGTSGDIAQNQPPPGPPQSSGGANVAATPAAPGSQPGNTGGPGGRVEPADVRGAAEPGVQSGPSAPSKPDEPQEPSTIPPPEQPPVVPAARKPKSSDPNAVNHVIRPGDVLAPKGRVGKLQANINAIMLLRRLEVENRNATSEEKKQLAQYTGWGQLSQAFDTRKMWEPKWEKDWKPWYEKLKQLLTDDEFRAATRSTQYAHFTSATVIEAMWEGVQQLGFFGGKVLEPAGGIGHFAGLQPENQREDSSWLMIDADEISARIMQKLYPESKVMSERFEAVPIPAGSIDLAITNVPFSDRTIDDPRYPMKLNTHNWFIAHMLDTLKPGGMVVTVTSGHTMDSHSAMRQFLATRAELMGAIRLPNTAFKENAGTEVTTDILFLRKPMTPQPEFGQNWAGLKTTKTYDGKDIQINEYFVDHPEMVAGRLSLEGTMYGGNEFATLPLEGIPLEETLSEMVQKLPKDVFGRAPSQFADFDNLGGAIGVKDGTMQVTDKGALVVARGGRFVDPVEIDDVFKQAKYVIQAKAYLNIAGAYKNLLALQLSPDSTDTSIEGTRKALNKLYDDYVKKYNYLNHRNTDYLEFEHSYYLLIGLENERVTVNEKTGKIRKDYIKADVFSKRTQFPRVAPETAQNPTDALQISLSYHGAVDVEYIGRLLNISPEQAEAQLLEENLAFKNPETQLLETPEQYLSGNVRRKLALAQAAAADEESLKRNVDALAAAQPPRKPFRKIRIYLGSTWVPDSVVTNFAKELFESEWGGVSYIKASDSWIVGGFSQTAKLLQTYGTDRRNGEDILGALLNQKTMKIYDTYTEPDGSTRQVFNEKATQAVRAASDKIEREYDAWLKKHADVQQILEQAYNEKVNNYVVRSYNIDRLDLPGASSEISLRANQRAAVWRFVQERHGLIGHTVGGGKTFIQVAIAMETKRLGLANKPMIAVMNSTLGQFAKAFRTMYPSANILIATKKDMEKENRKAFLGRIASGDYDSIIIPHSQFNMLEDDPEFEKEEIKKLVDELQGAIDEANAQVTARGGRAKKDPTLKQLEKAKEKLEDRLHDLADRKKEDVVTFQQLGIDLLMVDEAHQFKKPPFVTKRDKIAGLSTEQSQRAFSLFMKARYIQSRHGGRGVILSTGTPVTNTLGEAWHMLNLSSPHILKDYGVDTFDRFLSTFTRVTSEFDVNAVGKLILKDKLSRFVNLPELVKMIRSSWDIITQDDLRQILESMGKLYPKLVGGKVENIAVPRSEPVARFMKFLTEVFDKYNQLSGRDKRDYNYIPVMTFLAGKAAALDVRLVDATAKDDPGSKINKALARVIQIWKDTTPKRSTQAIFLDQMNPFTNGVMRLKEFAQGEGIKYESEGTEAEPREDMFLFNDMRKKLVAAGIPEKEIMIVNEHDTQAPTSAALFDRINAGDIRIVIGSTAKMGVGVNMQTKLIALHHLDVPWFPADLEQRNGRILRFGNENPEVIIAAWGTEKTADVGLYAKNEAKGKFMQQVLSGRVDVEESDDPAGALVMSLQEQMANLSGDPMLFEKVQLENRIRTLRLQKEAYEDEVYNKSHSRERLKLIIEERTKDAERDTVLLDYAKANLTPTKAEDAKLDAVIGNRKYADKKEVKEAIDNMIAQHKAKIAKHAGDGDLNISGKGYYDLGGLKSLKLGTINGASLTASFQARKETIKNEKGQPSIENRVAVEIINSMRGDQMLPSGMPTTGQGILEGLTGVEARLSLHIDTAKLSVKRATEEITEINKLLSTPFAGEQELAEAEAKYDAIRKIVEGATQDVQAGQKAADMLFDMKVDWAPLLVRIRNQLDRLVPIEDQLRHAELVAQTELAELKRFNVKDPKQLSAVKARLVAAQDQVEPVTARIKTLTARLATVEKARLESEFSGDAWLLPAGQTPSTRPGISYQIGGEPGSSTGEQLRARGIDEIREMLSDPRAGLSADVVRVANEMLDTPVMQSLDWRKLNVELKNRINGGGRGAATVADWLIEISRGASATTLPHEIFHFLFEMLPAADQERIEELRLEALDHLGIPPSKTTPPEAFMALLERLKRTPMTSQEFQRMREKAPKEEEVQLWLRMLYPLTTPSEFLAGMGGEKFSRESFSRRHESWFEGLFNRIKAWLQGLIDSLRRFFGQRVDFEQLYREILSGKRVSTPEAGATAERDLQMSIADDAAAKSAQDAQTANAEPWGTPSEEWVRTQVMGQDWFVKGREGLVSQPEIIAYAKSVFDRVKVPATWDSSRKIWVFDRTGFDQNLEFRNLLEEVKKEIQTHRDPGKPAGVLAGLLDSIRRNMPLANSALQDILPSLRNDLYAAAQGEISQYGLALGALSRLKPDFNDAAQSVDVVLNKIFSDAFGGPAIRDLIERVLTGFRDLFTEDEIKNAFGSKPGAQEFMEQLIALNIQDVGGRLYRRLQATLQPKRPLTPGKLERNAKIDEAYDSVIEMLKREYGIEPKERPGKKRLTPQEKLALMVDEKTSAAVGRAIASAVADAEYNAGRAAMIKAAEREKDPQKLQDLEDHLALMQQTAMDKDSRVEPLPEFVEQGLQTNEFKHWLNIRDNVGYSPTSMKLVQDVIRGDFKGTKFAAGKAKPADTRLDIAALAKAPGDEVTRVLDAFFDNVRDIVELGTASEETKSRVMTAIQGQTIQQLNQAMERARNPMFREPVAGTAITAEQRALQLLNAGLFADPRLNIPAMVQRAASKSAMQRLMPKVVDLTKDIFATPFYRQDELADRFADYLINKLGVDPSQAAKAKALFIEAFKPKMDKAREAAFKQAVDSLTTKERKAFKKRGIVEKLHRMLNAGGADPTELLNEIARENGYEVPTPATVARMRELSEREQRLRELTPADTAGLGPTPTPEDVEKARRDKATVTEGKRAAINRELAAEWARLTRPIKWSKFWSTRKNIADAINEVEVADMLLKAGFALRLPTHIATQLFVHIPTRAIGFVVEQLAQGEVPMDQAWTALSNRLVEAYQATVKAIKPGLIAAGSALAGRSEQRNVDRLLSGIAAFDRIELAAKEAEARGEKVRAGAMRLFGLVKFSLRYVQACDAMQGTSVEFQELTHLVDTGLTEKGYSEAEKIVLKDRILGSLGPKRETALSQAAQTFANAGETYTDAELHERAWALVLNGIYDQIKAAGLPADDFRQRIELLKRTAAWQERVTTGPGGLAAALGRGATQLFRNAGLPLSFTRFANAVGTGINYSLMFTPLYATAAWKIGQGAEESPWFKTPEDVQQRRIQALLGTLFGALIAYLVWKGLIRVFVRPPQDRRERELWEKAGHRPGTMEIVTGPDSFIPLSLTVGPASIVAPYLTGAQAMLDLADKRAKQQAKLDEEALRRGLTPGKLGPPDSFDLMAVAASTAWGTLMGSKTFSGIAQSVTENASFNVKKGIAAYVSPLVPGLPGYQEITRAMGWNMDPRLASVWDYLVPLPTSGGRALNFMGDPVGTPDAIQRVVQTLTAGSYPWEVDSGQLKKLARYETLFATDFRPPAVDPNKGYAIGGEWRPMTDDELEGYVQARAQAFSSELDALGPTDDPKLVQAAYKRANEAALTQVGVDLPAGKVTNTPVASRAATQAGLSGGGGPSYTPQAAPTTVSRGTQGAGYRTLGRSGAGPATSSGTPTLSGRTPQARRGRLPALRSHASARRHSAGAARRTQAGGLRIGSRRRAPALRR